MMENKSLLKTEGLCIGYHAKKEKTIIASDIKIQLEAGRMIALIGANGIGKSTLLKTLTGIQPAISGTVLLNGKPIQEFTPMYLSQQLSLVLTEKLPPSNLTVFELIALGRQPYTNWIGTLTDQDYAKINEAAALAQVTALASKKHYEISDGQLQKVLIARALAQDTPLIILDEPTTHLDLLHKINLFRLLKELSASSGKCILYSTHDIDLATEFSDSLIVMTSEGVVQDQPSQLISDGVFDRLFSGENIVFDTEKGKFIYKNL